MRCTERAGHTAEATLSKHKIYLLNKAAELPAGGAEKCARAVVIDLVLWSESCGEDVAGGEVAIVSSKIFINFDQ